VSILGRGCVMVDDEEPDSLGLAPVEPNLPVWKWACDDVLDKDTYFVCPSGIYQHVLLNTDDDDTTRNVCLPPGGKTLLKRIQVIHGYRWKSEPFRRLILKGMAKHDQLHGHKLHDMLGNNVLGDAVDNNNKKIIRIIEDGVKCDFNSKRCWTAKFSVDFWEMITDRQEEAGVCSSERWLAYLFVLALWDCPRFADRWRDDFKQVLQVMQEQLNERIDKLETVIQSGV